MKKEKLIMLTTNYLKNLLILTTHLKYTNIQHILIGKLLLKIYVRKINKK